MASPLWIKVYGEGGQLVASFRYAEDAALCAGNFPGGAVKMAGRIVWKEGCERLHAGDSFDTAAQIMLDRHKDHQVERMKRR